MSATVNPFRHLRSVPDDEGLTTAPSAPVMVRIAEGDHEAFAALYDQVSGLVFGIVRRVVRNETVAEEVTQEVFVDVWRRASTYRPDRGSVRSWVATIAHHRAVDRVRSEEAGRARDERDAQRTPTSDAEEVAVTVEQRLEHERVRRALEHLTPAQRETIELAYYGGHTYRQVATMLDMPEGTVKTRIRDGLIRLRDILGTTP
jgi:RNA polymerase sigma-70 factor (ECF subfamily)